MRTTITPAEAAEVEGLWAEYYEASMLAAQAMQTRGEPLQGEALRRVLEHNARAGRAITRIKEIHGVMTRV